MGWLGWKPDEVMAALVADIEGALEARGDLLSMIFGSGKKPDKKRGKGGLKDAFKRFTNRHNGSRKDG